MAKIMTKIRKWSRILHRDIGFFFVGASIIYGLSGIALNHIDDWNPNYVVVRKEVNTDLKITKDNISVTLPLLLQQWGIEKEYKTHYFPDAEHLKIFLKDNSTILLDLSTGSGIREKLKRRAIFYQVNYLHYNPNGWWTFFSDIFAGALILFAITGILMVKGKKGALGRGGIYILLGTIIPLLILLFS